MKETPAKQLPLSPFERLRVWHSALALARRVYEITGTFPDRERYGLSAQLRRAATSVVANLAEGSSRKGTKAFLAFCQIAYGSLRETEALAILSGELGLLTPERLKEFRVELSLTSRQLFRLITKLRSNIVARP